MSAGCLIDDCGFSDMSAGCLIDGCGCSYDVFFRPIGTIKLGGDDCNMDENKKGPFYHDCCCCEDEPSIPTPSYLTWVREHMSHEKYVSYLLGKYYESSYYFTNHGHSSGELARMNFYLEQILSELDEKASEKK